MFKIVLIFFSTIFFFFSYSSGINSLTKNQVIKIKQQINFIDPLVNKARSKESKLNKEKYKKSKVIFNSIKKKNWSEGACSTHIYSAISEKIDSFRMESKK